VKKMLKIFAVVSGLIFMCVGCQRAGNNVEKPGNPAEEYADKLLKARKDAKDAAGATEQRQKDVSRAIDEGTQKDK
jgi:hypothetical protein